MTFANLTNSFDPLRQLGLLWRVWRLRLNPWLADNIEGASQSMALSETRLPRLLSLTVLTLSAATFLFVGWAALTPVKELARTEGQALPGGYTQLVQHLEGGLVREILVHEGDFVQKGQVLVRLDGAGLEEDFHEQQDLVTALALESARLHAVLDGHEPDFSGSGASPAAIADQRRMYDSTRDSHASELAVIDEQIAQKRTMLPRLRQSLEAARRNLSGAKEGLDIYEGLAAKGLAARTVTLKKQEEYNGSQNTVDSLSQQLQQAQKELDEVGRRRQALVDQQRDTAFTELNKIDGDLAQSRENLKKRNNRVDRLEVRAPVAGYVKGLRLNTIGSVIPAGQTLMEIVPVNEQLVIELRILPQQIGRVAVGQVAQVKVDSYDYVRFGSIPGTLQSISAMTFTDDIRRQDYYKGRVLLSRNYAGSQPGLHPILPGMTVDADIVTGEKSVLGYLLKPIQVAMRNALTEQ